MLDSGLYLLQILQPPTPAPAPNSRYPNFPIIASNLKYNKLKALNIGLSYASFLELSKNIEIHYYSKFEQMQQSSSNRQTLRAEEINQSSKRIYGDDSKRKNRENITVEDFYKDASGERQKGASIGEKFVFMRGNGKNSSSEEFDESNFSEGASTNNLFPNENQNFMRLTREAENAITHDMSRVKLSSKEKKRNMFPTGQQFEMEQMGSKIQTEYDPTQSLGFAIKRETSEFLGTLRPIFYMNFADSSKPPIISAKLISSNTTSTIVLSKSKQDFTENTSNYIGKIKGNFSGTIFNVFGPGYSPSDAKANKQKLRSMQATVQYQSNSSGVFSKKPTFKHFRVYLVKPHFDYYMLEGANEGSDEIPLSQLHSRNRDKILLLKTRKPVWNQNQQAYTLKFEGKAKKHSTKNFILEDDAQENVRMIFGKSRQNEYEAELWNPLSPFVGLAIVLTTFVSKL